MTNSTLLTALCVVSLTLPASANLLAGFDINGDTGPTQAGYAALNGNLTTDSGTASGITVAYTLSSAGDFGRNRGGGGTLAANPREALLQDFVFGSSTVNLSVNITGLAPNTRYRVRTYNYDRTASNNALGLWFTGNDTTFNSNNNLITGHRNLQADATNVHQDLFLTSNGSGAIDLITRGANSTSSLLNGVEVYELQSTIPLATFDANADGAVAAGATALGFSGTTATATTAGLTLNLTTDRADNLRSRGASGDELLDDFAFATDLMTLSLSGLSIGQTYEMTLYAQDLTANMGDITRWDIDAGSGSFTAISTAHYNNQSDGAADLTFLVTPTATTINFSGSGDGASNLVYFNGLSVSSVVPEPGTLALFLMAGMGLAAFRRRR